VVPSILKFPDSRVDKQGYMMCVTSRKASAEKMVDQLALICDTYRVPEEVRHNGGCGFELHLQKFKFMKSYECASMHCLAKAYLKKCK
jgi:hypothetical protein